MTRRRSKTSGRDAAGALRGGLGAHGQPIPLSPAEAPTEPAPVSARDAGVPVCASVLAPTAGEGLAQTPAPTLWAPGAEAYVAGLLGVVR
jgi:hypothetical protein